MARNNLIQIRTGQTKPGPGVLEPGELGYAYGTEQKLYIGNSDPAGEPLIAGGVGENDHVAFAKEDGGASGSETVDADSFGGVPFEEFFDGPKPRPDRAASTQGLKDLEEKIKRDFFFYENQVVPINRFEGIYYSTTAYAPNNCIDYCSRNANISWSESEVTPSKGSNWTAGNYIILVIPCTNGNYYVSRQSVVEYNWLKPVSYIVYEKGNPQASFPILGRPQGFPYAITLNFSGMYLEDMYAEVIFSGEDSISGKYAPVAHTFGNSLVFYAKEKADKPMLIPLITLRRIYK